MFASVAPLSFLHFHLLLELSAVASQSALSPSALAALRARLEALAGVERLMVDEERGGLMIVALPDADREGLEDRVRAAIAEQGLDGVAMPLEVATHWPHPERHRVRFVGVERRPEPEGRVRVRVSLEWGGNLHEGSESGEGGVTLEMRTAALAAVKAVQELAPEDLRLRLTGVKQIRAFDQEITVVSLYRDMGPPQRLVGAVLTSEEPLRSAALAVLNSLNRVLGNYLSTVG
jgi:hypothetical protein